MVKLHDVLKSRQISFLLMFINILETKWLGKIHVGNGKGSKNIIRRIKPEIPFAKRHVQNIRTKWDREIV